MTPPLVTLTTDFGTRDSYVAQMKGAMLSLLPSLKLVDLSHEIPPQDIEHAARFMAEAAPRFPDGTLHVVVVDPGVGTDRDILFAELDHQKFVCPDNGLLTLCHKLATRSIIRKLTSPEVFGDSSSTFHGRDIMGPAAVRWAERNCIDDISIPVTTMHSLSLPVAEVGHQSCQGQIIGKDAFGNLMTNLTVEQLPTNRPESFQIEMEGQALTPTWVTTYAEAEPGSIVALVGSSGRVEIAMVNGSAAKRLELQSGTGITMSWQV